MRVQEFRDSIAAAFQLVGDWSSCVGKGEQDAWRSRAAQYRAAFESAKCPKASPRDRDDYQLALDQLANLLEEAKPIPPFLAATARTSTQSRASKYNSSASRAVRLGRAARSAMKRGYF